VYPEKSDADRDGCTRLSTTLLDGEKGCSCEGNVMITDDPIGAVMALVVYGYLAYLGYWLLFQRGRPGYEIPEPKALFHFFGGAG
jgi:hypothetical protein